MKKILGTAVVLFFDQLSKFLVRKFMYLGQEVKIFPFFSLTYICNSGGLFGIFPGKNTTLAFLTIVVLIFLWWGKRGLFPRKPLGEIAFALIFGGGVGNLLDRVIHGGVIDFLDFYFRNWHWPSFNFADIAVNCGILFWILATTMRNKDVPEFSENR